MRAPRRDTLEVREAFAEQNPTRLAHLLGRDFATSEPDAFILDVYLQQPVDPKPSAVFPVVFLNAQRLERTYIAPGELDHLIAILTDPSQLQRTGNEVAAALSGRESSTTSVAPKPLTIR